VTTAALGLPHGSYACTRTRALLRAEWIKLRSLRSTWLTITVLLLVLVVGGIDTVHAALRSGVQHSVDPIYDTTSTLVAQYAAALLGVLAFTGEYATGSVRSSLLAAPRRLHLYAAKVAVAAALTFAGAAVYVVLDLAVIGPILGIHAAPVPVLSLARAAVGVPIYLALITLLAAGLAGAIRYSAGALAVLAALLIGAEQIIAQQYLPTAGTNFVRAARHSASAPWTGLAVLTLWTATSLTLGAVAYRRRPA
jgi:ABC-2 type transport system permease protein